MDLNQPIEVKFTATRETLWKLHQLAEAGASALVRANEGDAARAKEWSDLSDSFQQSLSRAELAGTPVEPVPFPVSVSFAKSEMDGTPA